MTAALAVAWPVLLVLGVAASFLAVLVLTGVLAVVALVVHVVRGASS